MWGRDFKERWVGFYELEHLMSDNTQLKWGFKIPTTIFPKMEELTCFLFAMATMAKTHDEWVGLSIQSFILLRI